jgi:hypothetical protein
MEELYGKEEGIPEFFWKVHNQIRKDLEKIIKETGKEIVSPSYFQ